MLALCSCSTGGQKITVNGTEIVLGKTTVEDLSASGYTTTVEENLKIKARTATIDNPVKVVSKEGRDILMCSLLNKSSESVDALKCSLRGIIVNNGDADFVYKEQNLMEKWATLDQCKADNSAKLGYLEDVYSEWISVTWNADGLDWFVDYTTDGKLDFISAKLTIK